MPPLLEAALPLLIAMVVMWPAIVQILVAIARQRRTGQGA